jgi:hypothetical protein
MAIHPSGSFLTLFLGSFNEEKSQAHQASLDRETFYQKSAKNVVAYYCVVYFTPFRPSNSNFGYIEEGESTADYTFTACVGSFAYPGIDTQLQDISVLCFIQHVQRTKQWK